MSDFCSICSPEYFDIDLLKDALELEPGYSINVLCEGCNIRAIYKDESGKIYLARKFDKEVQLIPVNIEDLQLPN